MIITDFTVQHIKQAMAIARGSYGRERAFLPLLPDTPPPGIKPNGLGVAALEDGELLGFLCAAGTVENVLGINGLRGVYAPLHAHGVSPELDERVRVRVYSRLYQAAAELWADTGALCHMVALYAHEEAAREALFRHGFGMRVVEGAAQPSAIALDGVAAKDRLCELAAGQYELLDPLMDGLLTHLERSPMFMRYRDAGLGDIFKRRLTAGRSRFFAALDGARAVAYIELKHGGENFVCEAPGAMSICGAFCAPECRGSGLFHKLLTHVAGVAAGESCTLLSVDFESFNPNAWSFWHKRFAPYSVTLARRLDG